MHKLTRTKLTLEKRAATLRTLLVQGASETRLIEAARRVRDARIQILRSKLGEMPPVRTPQQDRRAAKLNEQIESLRAAAPTSILVEFRMASPKASN